MLYFLGHQNSPPVMVNMEDDMDMRLMDDMENITELMVEDDMDMTTMVTDDMDIIRRTNTSSCNTKKLVPAMKDIV